MDAVTVGRGVCRVASVLWMFWRRCTTVLAQVCFLGGDLRRKSGLYAFPWRRSPGTKAHLRHQCPPPAPTNDHWNHIGRTILRIVIARRSQLVSYACDCTAEQIEIVCLLVEDGRFREDFPGKAGFVFPKRIDTFVASEERIRYRHFIQETGFAEPDDLG